MKISIFNTVVGFLTGIGCLLIGAISMNNSWRNILGVVPGEITSIIQQCEKDLPRSKKCRIVLTAEVVDNKEGE